MRSAMHSRLGGCSATARRIGAAQRMCGRLLCLCLLGLLLTADASAQSWSVVWTQPNATVTEAQAFVYRLSVDGAASIVAATCASVAANTECRTPRPALGAGPHTLTLTAESGFGTSAPASITGQPPTTPTTIRLECRAADGVSTCTATVTVP